jgi:Peptidase family M23
MRTFTRLLTCITLAAVLTLVLAPGASPRAADAGSGALAPTPLTRPTPVLATDKKRHLIYEIQLDNVAGVPVRLEGLTIRARERTLASYAGAALEPLLLILDPEAPPRTIAPGQTAFLFLELTFPKHGDIPSHLKHKLTLFLLDGGEATEGRMSVQVKVSRRRPIVVAEPLRGEGIVAVDSHDGAVFPLDGEFVFSQRFALDFVVFDGESTFAGDPSLNESYFIYGAPIHAVGLGRIVAARDGVPENTPPISPPITTPEALLGNYVVQSLGEHRFALYAHMQPGSVAVAVGERVRRGQVLGLVGNTGNSDEPHLHFHVTSGPSPLATDGVPYVFERFRYDARINGESGEVVPADPPRIHKRQLPLNLDVIAFESGRPD